MNSFEGNPVLGLLMMVKAQTKAKICVLNCKCCVTERTCCLCSELNYELMTCLLEKKNWKTWFCYKKVQVMKDKRFQESRKIEYDQNKEGKENKR